jgi:hypothetical protein
MPVFLRSVAWCKACVLAFCCMVQCLCSCVLLHGAMLVFFTSLLHCVVLVLLRLLLHSVVLVFLRSVAWCNACVLAFCCMVQCLCSYVSVAWCSACVFTSPVAQCDHHSIRVVIFWCAAQSSVHFFQTKRLRFIQMPIKSNWPSIPSPAGDEGSVILKGTSINISHYYR